MQLTQMCTRGVLVLNVVAVYLVSSVLGGSNVKKVNSSLILRGKAEAEDVHSGISENWIFHLLMNIVGYATIFVPGYFIIQYVRKSNYLDKGGTCLVPVVRLCVFGNQGDKPTVEDGLSATQASSKPERSSWNEGILLLFCTFGLLGSYLIWGILQEKIMTQEYLNGSENVGKFSDSQFLVFVNRILAFILAGLYIIATHQPRHTSPLYKYSYCSFSNIMSSWCQYEALKYVSFPTQVLAKASKIIPVMIMGKIVSRKSYEYYEYVVAVMISLGMSFFLLGSQDDHGKSSVTTFSGLFILLGYMAFDSFTSNWQGELFSQYKMSSVQMMCGVNLFSCLLTAVSLLQQGGFISSLAFMTQYPKFLLDCLVLSLCSATGQLFIYYTISQFGPVVFVIIMTIRQAVAILLSCIIYHHFISVTGIIGIFIVFSAILLRTYSSQRMKSLKRRQTSSAVGKV